MGSITNYCESCQNDINSALRAHVKGIDFAIGEGGELHSSTARGCHTPTQCKINPIYTRF